ncbi:MAG: phosphotransferase [Trebonia sp.]
MPTSHQSPDHLPPGQDIPVPGTLEELLSPAWLSISLGSQFPGIKVTRVIRGPVVRRVSMNLRFRIECADGVPDGLAPHLCAKCYFTDACWPARRTGSIEASFYRDLAARTGVRTLRSRYADVHAESGHGIVITEDVVAQGGTFLDSLSPYTPDQAADSLRQLALLHAATWCDPIAVTAPWLAPRAEARTVHRGVTEIRANFESPDLGPGVPAEVRDAGRLHAAFRELADLTRESRPWSVVHGDAHIGNFYLDGAGRPSLLDWQLVQRGPWYLDVGYHIASALTVEDRRSHEDDLVHHYLDELRAASAARGTAVTLPTPAETRLGYRLGILYGLYHWGITKLVDRPVTGALLHRLGTAAADHDAYAAVADTRSAHGRLRGRLAAHMSRMRFWAHSYQPKSAVGMSRRLSPPRPRRFAMSASATA